MNQRAKQDYYRNIEGGSQGNAAVERFNEWQYGLQGIGMFSNKDAEKAFKGATRIGYTNRVEDTAQHTRQDAMDLLYSGTSSRGESVDEGLRRLQVASKSTEVSFKGLNDALEAVTESAGKAGVNTEMARAQFDQLFELGIKRGLGGGATGVAQAISQTNASYGNEYATQADSSAIYSYDMQYRAAALSGMTPGAVANLQRRNPVEFMKVVGKVTEQSIPQSGVTPEMRKWLQTEIERVGGKEVIEARPDRATDIGGRFLDEFGARLTPEAFIGNLERLSGHSFGGNMALAAEFLVQQEAGNTMAATAAKNQMQAGRTDLTGKMASGEQNAGVTKTLDEFSANTTENKRGAFGIPALLHVGDDQAEGAQAYMDQAKKTGQRDPVIEALLQNEALKGDDGDETMVEVDTKDGYRAVTLKEALTEFPNQVSRGEVRFLTGKAKGKSVGDLTGGTVNLEADSKSERSKASSTGVSMEDWLKEHPSEPGQEAGTGDKQAVQVGLTPEAAKYLQMMDPRMSSQSASSGMPTAPSPYGSPVGR